VEFYSIGVDLGGTNLRVASFDHNNGLRDSIELSTRRQDGRDAIISDLCDAVQSLIQKFTGLQECVGIGVATPGPMELPEGRLLNPPNLPGWENFELRQVLERRLRRTVVVENDANVAALAECVLGQGKELKVNSLCMVTLRTGVGSGIILTANHVSAQNKYIQSATLNGKPWDKPWFAHAAIAAGGELVLEMGNHPNVTWGSRRRMLRLR
jgi:glucokinase